MSCPWKLTTNFVARPAAGNMNSGILPPFCVFLRDFAPSSRCPERKIIRICSLGKSQNPKFSRRYAAVPPNTMKILKKTRAEKVKILLFFRVISYSGDFLARCTNVLGPVQKVCQKKGWEITVSKIVRRAHQTLLFATRAKKINFLWAPPI